MISEYDRKVLAEEKIRPLIGELMLRCRECCVPVFVSLATANSREETAYFNDMVSPRSLGLMLKDDKIADYVNILNGFYTVPVRKDFTLEYDTHIEEQ